MHGVNDRRELKMKKKVVFEVMLTLLLTSMFTVLNVQAVEIVGPIYIHADGSIDPPTAPIQRVGDIYTLTDNIVGQGISIGKDNVILDGAGHTLQRTWSGTGIPGPGISLAYRGNVTVKNTNVNDFWVGIWLLDSSNLNYVSGNTITGGVGIYLSSSNYNSISGNIVTNNNDFGIWLSSSNYNNLSGNFITNNHVGGVKFDSSNYCTISGNNITGNNLGIHLSSSDYNSVSNNLIANANADGVSLQAASSNNIFENKITGNKDGIWLSASDNSILGNIISNNQYGIRVFGSNSIYHNIFIDNTNQAYSFNATSIWDNGYPSGGNFWSSYRDSDADGDGIGDTPYVIDANNTDRYPLIVPTVWNYSTPIPVAFGGKANWVSLSSNSTISTFRFNQTQKQISFKVTGADGTIGSCRVTIPKTLLSGPYNILVNNSPPLTLSETSNGTHTFLGFTYNHSTKTIEIRSTSLGVAPQFPLATILILLTILIILAAVTVVLVKKKFPRRPKTESVG